MLVLFFCGCASNSAGISIEEIQNNLEEYEDKPITIKGTLKKSRVGMSSDLGMSYQLNKIPIYDCMEGIEGSHLLYPTDKEYEATGKIKSIMICTCQYEKYGGPWQDMPVPFKPVSVCQKESYQRCKNDSIDNYYYFKCSVPMFSDEI